MEQEIINYIKEARLHGLSDLEIKKNLLDAGWEAQAVEESFAHQKASENRLPSNVDEELDLSKKESLKTASFRPLPAEEKKPLQASPNLAQEENSKLAVFFRRTAVWASLLGIIAAAGSVSAVYFFWYASPERVWQKFTQLTESKILSSDFNFAYEDKTQSAPEDLMGFPLSNIRLEFSGQAYTDISDEQNPQGSSAISYSFISGNTKFSTGFEYRLLGKKLYLNVGDNPFMETVFSQFAPGKKIQWVVLDLGELEQKAQEGATGEAEKLKEIFNPEFLQEIKKLWQDAIFVKMDKYLGRDKVGGKTTLHFANSLDKETINRTLFAIIDKAVEGLNEQGVSGIQEKNMQNAKTAIKAIVDKLEIKQFETWVGMSDFRLYKVKFVSNAPSVISAAKAVTATPQKLSRDAKRLAEARQMTSALELYYNDNARYPESLNGQPIGLTPKYISLLPIAPTPADGNCTDYFNTYWYEAKADPEYGPAGSYEMTFCLGSDTSGYESGIQKLSPYGIQSVAECPSTPENCYKSLQPKLEGNNPEDADQSVEDEIKETVGKIDFSGEIQIDSSYSGHGEKQEVKAPEDAFNFLELLESAKEQIPEPPI